MQVYKHPSDDWGSYSRARNRLIQIQGGKIRGGDIWSDIDNGLKSSHILSNIGNVVAPVVGGLAGTFLGGPGIGSAVGAAVGSSANELLKSQGYGGIKGSGVRKHKKMRGGDYFYEPQPLTGKSHFSARAIHLNGGGIKG